LKNKKKRINQNQNKIHNYRICDFMIIYTKVLTKIDKMISI